MAQTIFARHALLPGGWRPNVRLPIADGRISAVEPDSAPQPGDNLVACAIPGIPNVHSHAFQRAMAGRAEIRGATTDTFWTWRETMYRFAFSFSPDEIESVAAMAYLEMLERGFTRVGEFHYLHHDPAGLPYDDIAECSVRIAAGAHTTGIRLTLLPSFYAHANFGGAPPAPGQRRFINDVDSFARIYERAVATVASLPAGNVGLAPHSLRAVTPEELRHVLALSADCPVHIHAAEQEKEVADSLAWSGQRPVEWLLEHAHVDARWCLIHATHLTTIETVGLASSGAVAGLCPVTEANLGDGIFPGADFIANGGAYGVGTDSNVLIGAPAEFRQLEYAQRLAARQRNVLAHGAGSTGRSLVDAALAGGSSALGAGSGVLVVGAPADIVALESGPGVPDNGDAVLDAWIFADLARVDSVWVAGNQVVNGGRHRHRDEVVRRFAATMRRLDRV
jgi:formimidoylglutamate deiminase